MAPSGAVIGLFPRATTPLEAITLRLSSEQIILMTHLVVWLLAFVSGVFLALRFFAIWYRKSVLLIDDGLLAASWIIVLFYCISASVSIALGTGSASANSFPSTIPSAPLLLDNVTRTMALTAGAWAKSAFAFGLLGLCDRRGVRWALLGLVLFVNMVAVGGIVTQWVRCRPIYKAWLLSVNGKCFERATSNGVAITVQAYYAFVDIVLVVLGYMLVWSKGLRLGEKAGIGFLGLLGLMASTAAILTAIEFSALNDATYAQSNIRSLLLSSIETPLIIIAASLPALRLLRSSTPKNPLRIRIRHPIKRRRPSSSSLTPLDPSSPYTNAARVPPRPLRPVSSRSFMTTSTKTDNKGSQQRGGLTSMGGSTENLAKGLDYNFQYWNSAIPPSSTTPIPPQTPVGGNYYYRQEQQQYGHEPALSTSSTLHAVPSTPENPPSSRGANPVSSPKTSGNTNTNINNNTNAYNWHATNPNSTYSLKNSNSNDNNSTSYNWHATNPHPPYHQSSTENNRPLTPLQEEQSRTTSNNGIPSWTSEFDSEVGLGRNTSTLKRNASTRRESPTLGLGAEWDDGNRSHIAARNTRERSLMEREREFEYDLPRTGGKSYFARLQAMSGLSGYTVGNPFTSRI
ncbi:hypothetical protein N0V93_007836 [Gnomoniopsis smithogilvyi]|uniref:Rhodopsin domain-containing protein n=1 Tax=Gnomoniopsis smithogilvyi TaxID=1191159 RepID=A0A9W8YKW5_9PEZI|nr:hypothetical protein N0V93_007836 [Gnomoniopsis smithogilvyi]